MNLTMLAASARAESSCSASQLNRSAPTFMTGPFNTMAAFRGNALEGATLWPDHCPNTTEPGQGFVTIPSGTRSLTGTLTPSQIAPTKASRSP